jgi:hypothetical protein
MGLRLYLFSLYSTLIVALGLWLLVFLNVNPFQAPYWIVGIFYLTLFLFFVALFAIILFYLKVWLTNREVIFSHLMPSLRQSMILALMIVGLLFLEQVGVLNWWVAGLFVIAVAMIELFFRSKK